jgi:micrococcal nuclease
MNLATPRNPFHPGNPHTCSFDPNNFSGWGKKRYNRNRNFQGENMNSHRRIAMAYGIFFLCAGCGPAAAARIPPPALEAATDSPPAATHTVTASGPCWSAAARREEATVTKVVDGDTIEVDEGGVPFRVRYVGIDAPELTGEPIAAESLAANRRLVGGKRIVMIRDLSEADRYGRLLRFALADGVFVNSELVRLGMARAAVFPPDVSCRAAFQAAEEEARAAKVGLWGIVLSPTPPGGEGGACAGGCVTPPAGCRIKGNINSRGEKIYHVPGGKYYDQTVIEPEKGERWFCSEEEAVAAGWRRSKE